MNNHDYVCLSGGGGGRLFGEHFTYSYEKCGIVSFICLAFRLVLFISFSLNKSLYLLFYFLPSVIYVRKCESVFSVLSCVDVRGRKKFV